MNRQNLRRLVEKNYDDLIDSAFDDSLKEVEAYLNNNLDMPFLYNDKKAVVGSVPDGQGGYTRNTEINLDEFVVESGISGLLSVWLFEASGRPRFLALNNDFANQVLANSRDLPEYITPSGATVDGEWLKYRLIPGLFEGARIPEDLEVFYKSQLDLPSLIEPGDTNFLLKKFPDLYKYGVLTMLYEDDLDSGNAGEAKASFSEQMAAYGAWVARFSRVVGQVRRAASSRSYRSRNRGRGLV